VSTSQITLLGAIAGFTIYLGLPLGRLRNPAPKLRAGLNAVAIGILLFLVWDVLTHAWEPTDAALGDHHWGTALSGGLVLAAGLAAGLMGLIYYDRWTAARRAAAAEAAAHDAAQSKGPGTAAAAELAAPPVPAPARAPEPPAWR